MGKHSSLLMVRCPRCRTSMPLTEDLTQCPECGRRMKGREGVLNFVSSAARDNEREYYDKAYQSKPTGRTDAKQEIGGFEPYWYTPTQPENEMLLASMGNLTGKTILLLGNGASSKELRFILDSPSHKPHGLFGSVRTCPGKDSGTVQYRALQREDNLCRH